VLFTGGKMILQKVFNFLRGNLTRRTMLFVLVPLSFASYFGIMGIAALLYPESYDWRFNSMTRLLYAQDNPEFHHSASLSVAVCGILMIPFAGYIRRRLHGIAPTAATIGAVAFFAVRSNSAWIHHPSRQAPFIFPPAPPPPCSPRCRRCRYPPAASPPYCGSPRRQRGPART
jgi:hypothetical protein